MISASLSLSLPRLGWKSTSMPRSLKICTAAGDNASEMRTLGLDMGGFLENMKCLARRAGTHTPRRRLWAPGPAAKVPLCRGEEWPGDPLRQQSDVLCCHRLAAPDTEAGRLIAVMREIVAGAFLLHQSHQLLGEVRLRVRCQRRDRGIDHLHAHRSVGTHSRILCQEIDPRRFTL